MFLTDLPNTKKDEGALLGLFDSTVCVTDVVLLWHFPILLPSRRVVVVNNCELITQ